MEGVNGTADVGVGNWGSGWYGKSMWTRAGKYDVGTVRKCEHTSFKESRIRISRQYPKIFKLTGSPQVVVLDL